MDGQVLIVENCTDNVQKEVNVEVTVAVTCQRVGASATMDGRGKTAH